MLYLSRKAGWRAASRCIARGLADRFNIFFARERQADGSFEAGYKVLLTKAGRFVGYA